MLKILYNYTTRSRRNNFLRGIQSIINNSSDNNYHILISIENEHHDKKMHPIPVLYCPHEYKVNPNAPTTKIDAINRDVNECEYEWDIIVNMSDDMVFVEKDFDKIIRENFVDSLDICLHLPDGNRSDLITLAVMGREYYKRFNYIYHPSYKSLWCDNEMTEVAKILGCYKFESKVIVKHLHPAYDPKLWDEQYRRTEALNGIDYENFMKRKQINFEI